MKPLASAFFAPKGPEGFDSSPYKNVSGPKGCEAFFSTFTNIFDHLSADQLLLPKLLQNVIFTDGFNIIDKYIQTS